MRAALLLLLVPALASADDGDELDVHGSVDEPLHQSHLIPITETVAIEVAIQLAAQLSGAEWAKISPSTMRDNLTASWVVDEDPFTIDQLGHPVQGALPFLAARSMGHGFWVSAAYSTVASFGWELLAENEPPSLNDQITTPIAGSLVGESFHRMSRALRAGNPGIVRKGAATLLDPVGAFNRGVFGKAWRDRVPPSYYAHLGVGWERVSGDGAAESATVSDELHLELVLEHGLPGDPDLKLRRPLDHFVLRGAVDLSADNTVGTFDIRGLVLGKRLDSARGFYGIYGLYDYMNPDGVRVSVIGVGPGASVEVAPTDSTYLRGTAVAALVPWGAAGGSSEMQGPPIDYHHGPGAQQILEVEFGRVGGSALRATSRAWEIAGGFVDSGREIITSHTVGGRWALSSSHALGVEGTLMTRSATFDAVPDTNTRTLEARVFYALTASQH